MTQKQWFSATLIGVLLVIGLSFSTASAQTDKKAVQERVMMVLKAYEYKTNPELWKRWGLETVNDILSEIALDISRKTRLRTRAALALSEIPTDRTKKTLRALISRKETPRGVRRQALYSMAIAFPDSAFVPLRDQLREGDVHIREAAALALVHVRDKSVELLLGYYLQHEKNMTVRAAVERALKMRSKLQKKPQEPYKLPHHPIPTGTNTDSLTGPDQRDKL
ncbi:MAG: hypothetical protein CMH54_07445 [Myxococcales bacterium]|nr:hypothetical protein [Myxococcales bacterium]|tara:strand:- start:869 stop:1537 length:669 start_codon:yes stop_codon:yes gene_type:complete